MIPVTIIPPTLPFRCYPDDPQEFANALFSQAVAFVQGQFAGTYQGTTEPPIDQRDKTWLHTGNQRQYNWNNTLGLWVRKFDAVIDSRKKVVWGGLAADIPTLDGGTPGAVGDCTGPLWEIDTIFEGRTLVGVGTIPTSGIDGDPDTVVAVGDTGGEGAHILTEEEGGGGEHIHAIGAHSGVGINFPYEHGATNTVPAFQGMDIAGTVSGPNAGLTNVTLFTLPSGLDAAGVTTIGHTNLQPYVVQYVLKRTARIYVTPPY
jgi:hypothetical protein